MNLLNILIYRIWEMVTEFIKLLPQLTIAIVLLVATWAIARLSRRLIRKLLHRSAVHGTLVNLAETLLSVVMWVLGLLIAMSVVLPSVTPANILAVLGLGSVAVGFAFKDIFENFLAGVLIMLRKPMRIGDIIECEGIGGRVENISLRDTHLRHLSNELVVVPNSFLFKNPVKILTDPLGRRYQISIGVGYGVDLDAAAKVIEEAAKGAAGVDGSKAIDVFASEFADSSMTLLVRWWGGSSQLDMHKTRDAVVRAIKRALDEAGMEIPFPYRTLSFAGPMPVASSGQRQRPEEGDQRDAGDDDHDRQG